VDLDGFSPAPWLGGPHLQTIVASFLEAPKLDVPVEILDVPVAEGTAVRTLLARPGRSARGTVLLVHGMGGSAGSPPVLHTAAQALNRGWAVARMNLRNCGGTEALSRSLYNAGQWGDVSRVLEALEASRFPRPFATVGFSLGGNLVLLHGGVARDGSPADAVAGVNPPVDLDACCRAMERPGNVIYQAHFTAVLCEQVRRVRELRPLPGPVAAAWRIRTVRRFDRFFTAPDAGFPSAEAYYAACSAGPHLGRIRVPALVLSAADDPFVPVEMFDRFRRTTNGNLVFAHPRRGGHLGYWRPRGPRFWAGGAVLDFFGEVLGS